MKQEVKELIRKAIDTRKPFFRAVVIDVIYDPLIYKSNDRGASMLQSIFGSLESRSIHDIPRNSIVAQLARTELIPDAPTQYIICYPFFSSHISLPVKTNEHVWIMFEEHFNENARINTLSGFWMSRIHESRSIEDTNFTVNDNRMLEPPDVLPLSAAQKMGIKPTQAQRREASKWWDDDIYPNLQYDNSLSQEDISDSQSSHLINDICSPAAQVHARQATPRFTKSPGDLVLQGSHNTLISLGQSREDSNVNFSPSGLVNSSASNINALNSGNGEIDIVVGRGETMSTANFKRINDKDFSSKSIDNENPREGDPDYQQDRARVMISSRRDPDDLLDINVGTSIHSVAVLQEAEQEVPENDGPNVKSQEVSSVIAMAEAIRLVARNDIKIVMKGLLPDGRDAASITLTPSGDVIIVPGEKGFIKLGGSDADRALLCTRLPAEIKEENGVNVTVERPITTDGKSLVKVESFSETNASREAAAEVGIDQAAFATRILVTGHGTKVSSGGQ